VSGTVDALRLRKIMGRRDWHVPILYGDAGHAGHGWAMRHRNGTTNIIVSRAHWPGEDVEWIHASISHTNHMPSYDELAQLHRAVFGEAWAYQMFAPTNDHVNIHAHALHLWGRADGQPVTPNFGMLGSI
jgi:hypothetical protein